VRWESEAARAREFEETVLVYLESLYNAALRLTQNRAEAEDVVQETFLRAFRGFAGFTPGTNCRAWLFTILRNVFLNRCRTEGREIAEEHAETLEAADGGLPGPGWRIENPEEEFFQSVLHGDVERALKALPLPFREAVVLADLEGLSYREIAEALGCPIGTVMSRLSRGRSLLRRGLRRFAREHGYTRDAE
jgi:RNA polymerase sigma-70 factor (ECF subfamily)